MAYKIARPSSFNTFFRSPSVDGPAPSEPAARQPVPPVDRARASARTQLAAWLESLAESAETLLGSKRWRVGNWLGQFSCLLRGLGNPPTAADDLCDVISRFRRWQRAAAHWTAPATSPAAPGSL